LAYAIKADYFHRKLEIPAISVQKNNNKETYSNRHVYLKKQDPEKPEFRFGYDECERPESRDAAEANIKFLLLEKQEVMRLGSQSAWFNNSIETIDRQIKRLQSAPNKN
jgi:hypothetical protein